jgi:hypothetical protein
MEGGVSPPEHITLNNTSFLWSLSSLDIFCGFRTYMLLGILAAVATNLIEPSSLIFYICDSNMRVYP